MSTDATFDTLARPFVVALKAKQALLEPGRLEAFQRARVLESMSDDLKKMCDVVVPFQRPAAVSQDAMAFAAGLGVDLCRLTWQGQPRIDPGRTQLHREHVRPILALRNLCLDAPDVDTAVIAVDRELHIAWITKAEDQRLTACGFRRARPERALAAYEEVGITLVRCSHGEAAR